MSPAEIQPATINGRRYSATLTNARRITPDDAREEVRELSFRCRDLAFDGRIGQCIRVLAPGQFGNRHHARLYSIADIDRSRSEATDFRICVRRCFTIDEFNGEEHPGVASNYLCDLSVGAEVDFHGPIGYPFTAPDDPESPLVMIGMGTGVAPFRGLVRSIYETRGGWSAPVRLFHGARSGLEMLYRNDRNNDLALYFDQPTFKAFEAISPRPHFGEPVAIDEAIAAHAAEVWTLMENERIRVYVAGSEALLPMIRKALAVPAGGVERYDERRQVLLGTAQWVQTLY